MGRYNNFYLVFTQFHQLFSITAIQRYRQWPLHRTLLLIIHGGRVCAANNPFGLLQSTSALHNDNVQFRARARFE